MAHTHTLIRAHWWGLRNSQCFVFVFYSHLNKTPQHPNKLSPCVSPFLFPNSGINSWVPDHSFLLSSTSLSVRLFHSLIGTTRPNLRSAPLIQSAAPAFLFSSSLPLSLSACHTLRFFYLPLCLHSRPSHPGPKPGHADLPSLRNAQVCTKCVHLHHKSNLSLPSCARSSLHDLFRSLNPPPRRLLITHGLGEELKQAKGN